VSTFYIKQAVFSWAESFAIKDETGADAYQVQGKVFSWGKNLTFLANGSPVATVKEKVLSLMDTFDIEIDGQPAARIVKKLTLLKPKFKVEGPDWDIHGDYMGHEYDIVGGDGVIMAHISKAWFTWGDSYKVDINPVAPETLVLALVIALDASDENEVDASALI
jgi:uncharacterized protein YxjI